MTIRNRFLGLICLWVGIVGALILFKQHTVQTGKEVLLRAMSRGTGRGPIGGVSLKYDINDIDMKRSKTAAYRPGERVYVSLVFSRGYATASGVHHQPPKEGLFLKGIVKAVGDDELHVKYRIEDYYPGPERKEQSYRYGAVLDVHVAVDAFGDATITGIS